MTSSKTVRLGKKLLRLVWKSAIVGVVGVGLLLATVFIADKMFIKAEQGKIKPYGQAVEVDGKKMNVLIQGDGEETIVLFPGLGTVAPVLDFKLLVDELSPYYKVVVVEPFGYGLSDETTKERSIENVVSEWHEALQQLDVKRYILMGHSIAGIYGIQYVNQYPDEVSAFIGIDSSVPNQPGMDDKSPTELLGFLKKSGLMRVAQKIGGDPYAGLAFDDETKEQISLISHRSGNNDTVLNEVKQVSSNFKKSQQWAFPVKLPLLLFVQAHDPEIKEWVALHEEQAKPSEYGKVINMEGSHYLHHTKYKEIAENVRTFMKEMTPVRE